MWIPMMRGLLVGLMLACLCETAFAYEKCNDYESCSEIEDNGFKNGISYANQQCKSKHCPTSCDIEISVQSDCVSVRPCPDCDYLTDILDRLK